MKIYFEDGRLYGNWSGVPEECYMDIDAKMGYSFCENLLRQIHNSKKKDVIIYTNAISALHNYYVWNKELNVPEIYLRNKEGKFERIDNFTARELREGHNIMKMYMSGEFEV